MAWFAVVERGTNRLLSIATSVPPAVSDTRDVINLGESRPADGTEWSPASRAFVPVPARVTIDRLDDVRAWLDADADFLALNATSRTRVRNVIGRLVPRLLGSQRLRFDDEPAELP